MRLVRVRVPEGHGDRVTRVAFESGIPNVARHQEQVFHASGGIEKTEVLDVHTSTPKAKAFLDALMRAPFFDPNIYRVDVREPRSIVAHESPRKITWPLVEPGPDILEELWQYSHVTLGFIGRCLIASMLLAYGMITGKLLFVIAGLLFYPLLTVVVAIGFGLWNRAWALAGQGLYALIVGLAAGTLGGIIVGSVLAPPLQFQESTPLWTGVLISLAVGVAAALATGDDAGERSLIGLAATAQIALVPVWLGVALMFGFQQAGGEDVATRLLKFAGNVACLIGGSWATYALLGFKGSSLQRFLERTEEPPAMGAKSRA